MANMLAQNTAKQKIKTQVLSANHPLAEYLSGKKKISIGTDEVQLLGKCTNPGSQGMWLVRKNGGSPEKMSETVLVQAVETLAACLLVVAQNDRRTRVPKHPRQIHIYSS